MDSDDDKRGGAMKRDPIQIIEAIAERQKIISSKKTLESTNNSLSSDPVQIDFWEDGKRAAPNAIFRSALFPAIHPKQKKNRRFIKNGKLFSTGGLEVIFTGEQFDQSDLDVYLEILNIARPYETVKISKIQRICKAILSRIF